MKIKNIKLIHLETKKSNIIFQQLIFKFKFLIIFKTKTFYTKQKFKIMNTMNLITSSVYNRIF